MLIICRETPVGYALLKAKSTKILGKDGFNGEDESAEAICNLYAIHDPHYAPAALSIPQDH